MEPDWNGPRSPTGRHARRKDVPPTLQESALYGIQGPDPGLGCTPHHDPSTGIRPSPTRPTEYGRPNRSPGFPWLSNSPHAEGKGGDRNGMTEAIQRRAGPGRVPSHYERPAFGRGAKITASIARSPGERLTREMSA